ncbi:nucleophile aminohydrolase [Pelagophyceae sp. CCMP2097]|nr:nucleophile aminohydrolase [Pelagophyceae sp. CCMP2097]|mmetsp:Transcript_27765/g.93313  ORF Transcript_27765/g.93313 Transcript_27765/m.93313 type:complete len:249 (-) Transcript_27765:33-779(-)
MASSGGGGASKRSSAAGASVRWLRVACVALAAAAAGASDPLTHNGGALLALTGRGCVAVVADTRLGAGPSLVGERAVRVLHAAPRAILALHGLQGDVFTLLDDVAAELRRRWVEHEARGLIEPRELAELLSTTLYGGRAEGKAPGGFYVEPVIAGLARNGAPFLCQQDSMGSMVVSVDYVACGSAKAALLGMCEALYRPDLEPDELLDVAERCARAALDRDCLSGCRAQVHLLSKERGLEFFEFDLAP